MTWMTNVPRRGPAFPATQASTAPPTTQATTPWKARTKAGLRAAETKYLVLPMGIHP